MVSHGVRGLKRKEKIVPPRPLYLIVTEGETEKNYFLMIKKRKTSNIAIKCLKAKHPDTIYIIKSANELLCNCADRSLSQCWIVLDTDVLRAVDITELKRWQASNSGKRVGITNPIFEYWMLLHFESPEKEIKKEHCKSKLSKHIPGYQTPFSNCQLLWPRIDYAISNAQARAITLEDIHKPNGTNLHILVKKLI